MTGIYNLSTNEVVEEARMPEPILHRDAINSYNIEMSEYQQYLKSLKHYPCAPSCKTAWIDQQRVTDGVDYEVAPEFHPDCYSGKKCTMRCHSSCEKIDDPKLIAYTLTSALQGEDDCWQSVRENMILGNIVIKQNFNYELQINRPLS